MSDSKITKNAVASALKQICQKKNFVKISIQDITSECGLNRQSFYYHFQDKYELLSWIYYEMFSELTKDMNFENWEQKIEELFLIMRMEKSFFMNTFHEPEQTLKKYLFEISKSLFLEAIEALDKRNVLSEQDKTFDAAFYAYGVSDVILDWIAGGMQKSPAILAHQLKRLAENSEKAAFVFFETQGR